MRQKIGKVSIIFVCVMIAFTILSRVAYNFSTPKVVLGIPETMEMGPEVFGSGVVEAKQEIPVTVMGQQVVQKVNILPGQAVNEGAVLFELDMETLEEQIAEKQQELKMTDLQIQAAQSAKAASEQSKVIARSQAEEDYRRAKAAGDKMVREAEQEWSDAKKAYEEYKANPEAFPEKTEEELVQLVKEKEKACENAVDAREESLYQAKKAVDSMRVPEAKDTSIEQMTINRQTSERGLQKLLELQSAEGKIQSPVNGTVLKVNVEAGGMTSGMGDVLIAGEESGLVLRAQIAEKDKAYAVKGAEVEVQTNAGSDAGKNIGALRMDTISPSADGTGGVEAMIPLPADSFPIGTSVSFKIVTEKQRYTSCILLEALHQSGGDTFFVYMTDTKKSFLGEETVAQRIDVSIKYKGERYVAVEGIPGGKEVIYSSTKQLKNGGRVKPQEQ